MADLRYLVEARVRDYNRRKAAGEIDPAPKTPPDSLEAQLVSEIRALREGARRCEDSSRRDEMLRRANDLQTQLMVLLERTGRPLLARILAERLR